MKYVLKFNKAYYGLVEYDLFIGSSFPDLETMSLDELLCSKDRIVDAIVLCIGGFRYRVESTIKFTIRAAFESNGLKVPEAFVAYGNGFHLTWERYDDE